jgi:hypothetical protein
MQNMLKRRKNILREGKENSLEKKGFKIRQKKYIAGQNKIMLDSYSFVRSGDMECQYYGPLYFVRNDRTCVVSSASSTVILDSQSMTAVSMLAKLLLHIIDIHCRLQSAILTNLI